MIASLTNHGKITCNGRCRTGSLTVPDGVPDGVPVRQFNTGVNTGNCHRVENLVSWAQR